MYRVCREWRTVTGRSHLRTSINGRADVQSLPRDVVEGGRLRRLHITWLRFPRGLPEATSEVPRRTVPNSHMKGVWAMSMGTLAVQTEPLYKPFEPREGEPRQPKKAF